MSDKELQHSILAELEFDPKIDAAHVGVAVDNGVVTLSGHVTTYAERLAAEQAVRQIKGVRAIAQEIEVRYATDKKTSDDEIAKRALSIVGWSTTVPQDAIKLTVQKGLVTLSGQVDWQFQKKAAEEAVWKLSGVTGVINNIRLNPTVVASDIKRKLEDALERRARVEADAIRIHVVDGNKVTIEGNVGSWDELNAVEDAAWSVAGVQSVDDRLTIG